MKRPPGSGKLEGERGIAPGPQPKAELSAFPNFPEECKTLILMWKFLIVRFGDLFIS